MKNILAICTILAVLVTSAYAAVPVPSSSTSNYISPAEALSKELIRANQLSEARLRAELVEVNSKQNVTLNSLTSVLHTGTDNGIDIREAKEMTKKTLEQTQVNNNDINSMGRQHFKGTVALLVVGLVVGGIIIFLVIRMKSDVTAALEPIATGLETALEPVTTAIQENTCAVDGLTARVTAVETQLVDLPNRVAKAVRQVESTTLDIPDVDGKNVKYVVPITADGERYITLHVPESVTRPVANPAQIIRVECGGNIGKLIDSVRRSVREYNTILTIPEAVRSERQKQVVALFEHLDSTGVLKTS